MSRMRAVEYGLAVGLVIGMVLLVDPYGGNDFSAVFWQAGKVEEPYDKAVYPAHHFFAYPVWNVWVLRLLSLPLPGVGLACIYALGVLAVLELAPRWGTPAWLVLLSPVFLKGILFAQPFEVLVFVGLTLVVVGWESEWVVGLGLCLLIFKMQVGFVPALFIGLRRLRATLLPVLMVLVTTGADFVLTRRLWVSPWWQALSYAPEAAWNDSLWARLGFFSLLWIPVGLWLLKMVWGDLRKELWVVVAVGMLCMPYWSSISLWPLVAMVGCWGTNRAQSGT